MSCDMLRVRRHSEQLIKQDPSINIYHHTLTLCVHVYVAVVSHTCIFNQLPLKVLTGPADTRGTSGFTSDVSYLSLALNLWFATKPMLCFYFSFFSFSKKPQWFMFLSRLSQHLAQVWERSCSGFIR